MTCGRVRCEAACSHPVPPRDGGCCPLCTGESWPLPSLAPYSQKACHLDAHLKKNIYLFERQGDRERGRWKQRAIFHPSVYSPNACNNQGWARPKSGARTSTGVSHMGGRDQLLEPPPAASEVCTSRQLQSKVESGLEPALLWDGDVPSSVTLFTKGPALCFFLVISMPFYLVPR